MAVRFCAEGGAGAPCGHRITGDPTRGCRGGAGRGLRLGAGERAMIATGLAQGDLGRPHRPPDRPVPADRVPRDPPWGGPGRGLPPRGGAGRGPGAVGPPQDPQAGRQPGPARAGRRPARGIGSVPGRSPPACGSRTPMMRACASVTSRSTRPCTFRAPAACAPSCGWRGPCAPDAPAASPAPRWPEKPEPRGRSRIPGRHHQSAPARGRRQGRPRALGGRPDHRRRPPAAP